MINNFYVRIFALDWFDINSLNWGVNEPKTTHWRFYWHENAGVRLRSGETILDTEAGRFYFVPSQIEFHGESTRASRQFYVHFDVLGLNRPLQQLAFSRPIALPAELSTTDLTGLLRPKKGSTTAQICRAQSLIYEGLALCLEALSPAQRLQSEGLSAQMADILPALDFIEEQLSQPLRVADLARRCMMSESLFGRRFRESMGQTPVAHILERRIARACQLLLFSDSSIENIAQLVGFGDRFYFSRQFRRHIGIAPAKYRQTQRL